MTSFQALARTAAAFRGRLRVAGPVVNRTVNNNRNNASLPRAGD